MKEIKNASELVAVAVRQGLEMKETEAAVVLGYIEGHDYTLLMGEDFTMMLHDIAGGEGNDNDMPYNIRQAVEFCQEMNEELLLDNSAKDDPDEEYLLDLRKDELILDGLMKRAETVIPPTVQKYNVVIIEHLKKVAPVDAASWAEARMKVEDAWKSGDYVLTAEDFAGVLFTLA
jgi:hypothetical protein